VPSDEIHPRRSAGTAPVRWTRSALTSALLAIAAVAPAASIAAEPDSSQEGGGLPEQVVDPDSDSPSFDPGGETDLPYETGPQSPEDSPDSAPLESEPVDDPEGRAAPFVSPQPPTPGGPEDPPARPLEESPPAVPAPGFSIEPPATTPSPPQPVSVPPQVIGAEPASGPKARQLTWTVAAAVNRSLGNPVDGTPDTHPVDPAAGSETIGPTEAAPVAHRSATARQSKADSRRIHVVRAGESLWTIAESLLGSDAGATMIAAEVARLWELNRDRIPSGDPDLIGVGQQLKLR
jgi:LysM domain